MWKGEISLARTLEDGSLDLGSCQIVQAKAITMTLMEEISVSNFKSFEKCCQTFSPPVTFVNLLLFSFQNGPFTFLLLHLPTFVPHKLDTICIFSRLLSRTKSLDSTLPGMFAVFGTNHVVVKQRVVSQSFHITPLTCP